ncbi:right-handed parallel beta-helix repeat-containing protein [Actinomadura sp. 3N407]|uniref:right-handed parallel beta-helix repeat-containing protein n=1 Tax=Actinomadura sp. 3N407 TaxID=3457423 RepID=UPI003FCEDDED
MRRTFAASLGAVVAVAGLAAFTPAGQASTIVTPSREHARVHVVKPGHSIQKAVRKARPGDVIQLKAGHYDGGVLVRKRLTIRGVGSETVLRPGKKDHCAKVEQPGMGICVIGRAKHPVKGVTIKKLSVRNFKASGVLGYYTDRLTVEYVLAKKNGEYGIAEFRSTRGRFLHNWVERSGEHAGLYVGDIANAHGTVVAENHASGNAMGLLIRHARHIKVWGNTFVRNCTGITLVDDGQPGGQGNTEIWKNEVSKNNRNCKPHGPVPALHGTGILFFGGDHNTIKKNTVKRNRGRLPYSGGIVLFPGVPPKNRPAEHNLIKANHVRGNAPHDLVDKSGSKTNRFRGNHCKTSDPRGLC